MCAPQPGWRALRSVELGFAPSEQPSPRIPLPAPSPGCAARPPSHTTETVTGSPQVKALKTTALCVEGAGAASAGAACTGGDSGKPTLELLVDCRPVDEASNPALLAHRPWARAPLGRVPATIESAVLMPRWLGHSTHLRAPLASSPVVLSVSGVVLFSGRRASLAFCPLAARGLFCLLLVGSLVVHSSDDSDGDSDAGSDGDIGGNTDDKDRRGVLRRVRRRGIFDVHHALGVLAQADRRRHSRNPVVWGLRHAGARAGRAPVADTSPPLSPSFAPSFAPPFTAASAAAPVLL